MINHNSFVIFFSSEILDYDCVLKSGDGKGGSETRVGSQTGSACVSLCREAQKINKRINGATMRKDGKPGCYCELGMTRIASSSTYKTCFIVVKTKGRSIDIN